MAEAQLSDPAAATAASTEIPPGAPAPAPAAEAPPPLPATAPAPAPALAPGVPVLYIPLPRQGAPSQGPAQLGQLGQQGTTGGGLLAVALAFGLGWLVGRRR